MSRFRPIACLGLTLLLGCQEPDRSPAPGYYTADHTRNAPTEQMIVKVLAIWQPEPWIPDPADGVTPIGLYFTLYLIGEDQNGVFGDGTIRVRMARVEREPGGRLLGRQPIQTWEWNPQEAVPFRSKRVTYLGRGYGMLVHWGAADVLGQEIEVYPEFVRRDGRVVTCAPKSLRVP
jgi:hypothetical protein